MSLILNLRPEERDLIESNPRISGIYQIFNMNNGKVYIGSSCEIGKRFKAHSWRLRSGQHPNIFLQRAFNAPDSSLVFSIIEECPREILNNREECYIELYRSRSDEFGYNLQSAKLSNNSNRWNLDICDKISNSRKLFDIQHPEQSFARYENLKKFWRNNPYFKHRCKSRDFLNIESGKIFSGCIPDMVKMFPQHRLDRAALLRVAQGKKRIHKNWTKYVINT